MGEQRGARAAGSRATPDPDADARARRAGEPTGVVREHAVRLFAALEEPIRRGRLDRVRAAVERLLAHGITAVHDFEGADESRLLETVAGQGPRVRVLMNLPHYGLDQALKERWTTEFTYRELASFGDDSSNYWWKLGAAERDHAASAATTPASSRALAGRPDGQELGRGGAAPAGLDAALHDPREAASRRGTTSSSSPSRRTSA